MSTRSTRVDVIGAASAGLLVVGFCLLLLRHDPLVFWNDDYQLSILPVFADVARSWNEGHFPLLSPYSWVCSNLAGEFQYGTFSIFINAAVISIWKFPLTFPQQAAALSITHLFVLAAGAFLLARDRKFSFPVSIFVALIAALNGWIICWGATDWFGALGAFAWLPWAWWGLERALDRQRTRWRFFWPAPFVYLVITGGVNRGIHLATAHVDQTNEMGARFTFGRALARNDSNRGRFSVEFSLVAAFSSRARTLRRRSSESTPKLTHGIDNSPGPDRRDN